MKAKCTFYNITFGLLSQLLVMAFGLIIPRLFILNYGSEINGFMASIVQIFIYMTILEAGVGLASIQALYKPIYGNNKDEMNTILAATSKYYKKTGIYYLIGVIIMAIVYPLCIKSTISNINVFLVIFFTGLVGVVNFYYQAKFKTLLTAEGKSYVLTNATMIATTLSNLVKIALILLGYNIVLIQLSFFVINFIQIIIIKVYIKKNYKWIDLNVKPNYDAISQKNSVLVHQISGMIFCNTDVLILSVFCGLKVVSVYVLYNYIFGMITSLINNINTGVLFIFGSSYNEDRNKFLKLYNAYEVYYVAIVFALYSITYILVLPFMKLYTAGIRDANYINYWLPILFVIVSLMSGARNTGLNAINIAGHFKKTQNKAIFESSINIVVSLICVNKFGIYGVLMGTIAALLYRTNDIIIYTSKYILKTNPLITYKRWVINITLFLSVIFIVTKLNLLVNSYTTFAITGVILLIIIIPIFFIIVSIFDTKSFNYVFGYLRKYLHR